MSPKEVKRAEQGSAELTKTIGRPEKGKCLAKAVLKAHTSEDRKRKRATKLVAQPPRAIKAMKSHQDRHRSLRLDM